MARTYPCVRPALQADVDICLSGRDAVAKEQQGRAELADRIVELYDTLRMPVFRYLVCLGMTAEEAQEIIQESFLRAFQRFGTRDDRENNIRAWIFRVAHNLAANQHKKNRRASTRLDPSLADLSDSIIDQSPSAEERLLEEEKYVRLRAAIENLSGQQLQCICLRGAGLRYREIAEIMGMSISSIAETLYRTYDQLRSY